VSPSQVQHLVRIWDLVSRLRRSEHAVAVSRPFGYRLEHVPVLYHLAVGIQAEDVDAGPVRLTGPDLVAVQHHVVALSDHPHELYLLARVRARHLLKVLDEPVLAVGHVRVVLGVRSPNVPLHGFAGLALVEHQVVERRNGSLVPLQSVIHQHPPL